LWAWPKNKGAPRLPPVYRGRRPVFPGGRMQKILDVLLKCICGVLVYSILAIVVVGIFCRFVLNSPVMWTEELGSIVLAFVVFIGAGLTYYSNEMVKMDFIFIRFPAKTQAILQLIFDCIITASALFLIWPAFRFLRNFVKVKTVILKISYAVSFSSTLIIMLMFAVIGIVRVYTTIAKIRKHELWK
jgi:TRAP-type C4-dicarboxylate transport system permease small subunit